ncbi:tail fiber domain-containing protein [Lacinutrix gracilariae]|uniref:Tail fiber domain-containing protein n=1 Tax=Lacinutrix gracilariae TaxID=1747198 RepID=A0ABW5JWF3_9FLAO
MKSKLTFLLFMCITCFGFAQNGINYKAVIKDDLGNIVANDLIVIEFSILQGVAQTNVYTETHTPTTNDNGIIIVNIGEGTPISGIFSDIDWSSNNHFLNVQVNTGPGLVDMGTSAFKSVPYAMSASTIELPYYGDTAYSGAAFQVHNNFTNGTYGIVGSTGTDGATIPANRAGVLGYSTNAHGVYGVSVNGFFAGVQGISESATGVGIQGYAIGGGVGGHFYTSSSGKAALTTGVGNVGFGISTPVNPVSILQTTGSANTVRIESQDHPTGKDLLELIVPSGSTSNSQFIEMQNGTAIVAAVNSDGSAKFTKLGVDGYPTGKLHIFQQSQTVGTGLRFDDGSVNADWDITHGYSLRFHYGGTLKGFINVSTGAYVVSSDVRLKNEIQEIPSMLRKVDLLRPTTYVYKSDESRKQALGFIAQEVQEIFPEVVHYSEADDLYGIDYGGFSVIAIKAIQEQQTIIEYQQKQIDELKILVQSLLEKQ